MNEHTVKLLLSNDPAMPQFHRIGCTEQNGVHYCFGLALSPELKIPHVSVLRDDTKQMWVGAWDEVLKSAIAQFATITPATSATH